MTRATIKDAFMVGNRKGDNEAQFILSFQLASSCLIKVKQRRWSKEENAKKKEIAGQSQGG